MSRFSVSAIIVALTIFFLVGDAMAQGRRETDEADSALVEMAVRATDGGDVAEGSSVVVIGEVTRVGNEPFVTTVVRTAAPEDFGAERDTDPRSVWVIELTGELVEEIERSYQERIVVLDGVLEALPAGVSYGRLRVEAVSLP